MPLQLGLTRQVLGLGCTTWSGTGCVLQLVQVRQTCSESSSSPCVWCHCSAC